MGRFLWGVAAGVCLALVAFAVALFSLGRLAGRPPAVNPHSVLVIELNGGIPERPPVTVPLPYFEARAPLTVSEAWRLMRAAETDSRIRAVVFQPGQLDVGWGKLQELRQDLARLAGTGKPVVSLLRSPSLPAYYLATATQKIHMLPEEWLNLKGLRAEVTYFGETLRKIGVEVEIEHAGRYKDFGDMFTRTSMSPETREVLSSILDELYDHLAQTVAGRIGMTPAEARSLLDQGPFLAKEAVSHGLVQSLLYEDQLFEELNRQAGVRLRRIGARDYLRAAAAAETAANKVALVIGEGTISRDLSLYAEAGSGISPEGFGKLLRQVGDDAGIRAVVVRIDSPGGDSFASDEIWREMNLLSRKKPMVISLSDEAASGGYYIAQTGDPVIAYPGTLTGSIGVVFGKVNLRGLYSKLGVRKELLTRGRFADIDSDAQPLSREARELLRRGLDRNYRSFVTRVAEARKRKFEEVESLAQGRVWLGSQAREKGLIDELGGLDRALELARAKAGIPASEKISVVVYPRRRALLEQLLIRRPAASSPAWLTAFLERWPAELLSGGRLLRLMPCAVRIR